MPCFNHTISRMTMTLSPLRIGLFEELDRREQGP
jgi:hypothetical protein